ncbi:MAG: DUF1015 domain-containing protein [Actinobacteria bacterium]|nr:DUF1015 domain-containing protein [Actinomycetota bacterium]
MPRFEPFAGLRYQMSANLDPVTAPPYDVIDEPERAELAARSPYNAVRLELPVDDDAEEGEDRYQAAARLLRRWVEIGMVVADDPASFYLYRMGYHDEVGRPRQTTGVIGALGLEPLGEGDVLPHEHTTARAKSDRLQLLEATKCNVSPIWCLSLAQGLAAMVEPLGPPFARSTDDEGVHHRLWRVNSPAIVDTIAEVVASAPVIIADGHHRYETALAYRDQREATTSGFAGHDLVMALVVELAEDEVSVRPIHRLLTGLPEDLDVVEALSGWFQVEEIADANGPVNGVALAESMAAAGALGLALPDGRTVLLHPRAGVFPDDVLDLDASRADLAREGLPPHEVAYRHDACDVVARVRDAPGSAGLLLRPATVDQIADAARQGVRMPPKTTYFHPKPRTGMVFRSIDR